jgi:hypothetical protein
VKPDALEDLVHDVKSKCASLVGAAALLRESSEPDRAELLALMAGQADSLAGLLEGFRKEKPRR